MARTRATTAASPTSRRTRRNSRFSSLIGLAATSAAGVCVLGGCSSGATASAMDLTVSAVTDAPVTVYFDTVERGQSGEAGRDIPSTPVELSPQHPSVVLPISHDPGYWLWVRVAGPPDRPAGMTVGCELRSADGRVLAVDSTDPFDPPTDDASCAGAG